MKGPIPTRAVLDACVLLPIGLCDVLLQLAGASTFEPVWSRHILGEVERRLVAPTFSVPPDKALKRLSAMRTAFPDLVFSHEWVFGGRVVT
jgi:hypothetical protein